jgi:hypothetical protein
VNFVPGLKDKNKAEKDAILPLAKNGILHHPVLPCQTNPAPRRTLLRLAFTSFFCGIGNSEGNLLTARGQIYYLFVTTA